MGIKLFNWTNKKKLVMLKHMVSMVNNKASLKNWVFCIPTKKPQSSPATNDTKLDTKLMLCCSIFT